MQSPLNLDSRGVIILVYPFEDGRSSCCNSNVGIKTCLVYLNVLKECATLGISFGVARVGKMDGCRVVSGSCLLRYVMAVCSVTFTSFENGRRISIICHSQISLFGTKAVLWCHNIFLSWVASRKCPKRPRGGQVACGYPTVAQQYSPFSL